MSAPSSQRFITFRLTNTFPTLCTTEICCIQQRFQVYCTSICSAGSFLMTMKQRTETMVSVIRFMTTAAREFKHTVQNEGRVTGGCLPNPASPWVKVIPFRCERRNGGRDYGWCGAMYGLYRHVSTGRRLECCFDCDAQTVLHCSM